MINVGEIVVDPDFVQGFTYIRRELLWDNGRYTTTEETHTATGTIISRDNQEMNLQEGGILNSGSIGVWTHEKLYVTSDNPNDHLADIIIYKGRRYIVNNNRDHSEYGYNRYECTIEAAA